MKSSPQFYSPVTGEGRHENHPEPQHQIEHLVEEVDGQHTLDCVTLDVTQTAYFEVTHRHTRESV